MSTEDDLELRLAQVALSGLVLLWLLLPLLTPSPGAAPSADLGPEDRAVLVAPRP